MSHSKNSRQSPQIIQMAGRNNLRGHTNSHGGDPMQDITQSHENRHNYPVSPQFNPNSKNYSGHNCGVGQPNGGKGPIGSHYHNAPRPDD